MVRKVPKTPVCLAIAFCGQAFAFQLVAVAGSGWLISWSTLGCELAHMGLFRTCDAQRCYIPKYGSFPDWWTVSQVFSILGLVAITGTLTFRILHFFLENTRVLSLSGIASSLGSVVFLIIEIATSGAMIGASSDSFAYGFVLSVISCVLCFFSIALFTLNVLRLRQ